MAKAKITQTMGKTAVTLPEELAKRFRLFPGETVYVRPTARGLEITGLNPAEEDDLRDAERTLQRYRDSLRYAGG